MFAKAGLGLIGLSAISVGGVALAKPGWLGMGEKPMPDYHPLFKDSDYESKKSGEYGSDKFGGKYKHYLVGVTTEKDGDNKTNEKWWEWSFKRLKEDKPKSTKFKHEDKPETDAVTTWHSTDENNGGNKALNQICKAAYKAETGKITTNGSGDGEYKEEDVWKYCSVLGEKPKTVEERGEKNNYKNNYKNNNAIGHEENESKQLVSTTGNDKFWEIRDKEFKNKDGYEKVDTTDDAFFATSKQKTIRQLCEEAYNKSKDTNSSTQDNPAKSKVTKYCSLDKQ